MSTALDTRTAGAHGARPCSGASGSAERILADFRGSSGAENLRVILVLAEDLPRAEKAEIGRKMFDDLAKPEPVVSAELISLKEAAGRARCTEKTMKAWCDRFKIGWKLANNRWAVDPRRLSAHLSAPHKFP
jgi:hypothetical protein